MRVAFVDLNFSWPPNGGADVDLFNVALGLQDHGFQVHLFVLHETGSSERGLVRPQEMPFACTRIERSGHGLRPASLAKAFREPIDEWRPDVVFLMHAFALKPYLTLGLRHHHLISRFYAHELACMKDPMRFLDGAPCPRDYLRTPDDCRQCGLEYLREDFASKQRHAFTSDYLAARAYAPGYYHVVRQSLAAVKTIVVSNAALRAHLDGFHRDVAVVPGGVHTEGIQPAPLPAHGKKDTKVILMTGRAEDPVKGLRVLQEAGNTLYKHRQDFEIWATHFDRMLTHGFFRALGWRNHAETLALYPRADICVVPSVWEEPFGIVAVEAMAAGRPVCASAVGGLREIVRDGVTGFLFGPRNTAELAAKLDALLDDSGLRQRMGAAGRAVVENEYDWKRIIERHYVPLLERARP